MIKISKWVGEKGYGFVRLNDGQSAFLHIKQVEHSFPRGVDLTGFSIKDCKMTKEGGKLSVAAVVLAPTGIDGHRMSMETIYFDALYGQTKERKNFQFMTYEWDQRHNQRPIWNDEADKLFEEYKFPEEFISEVKIAFARREEGYLQSKAYAEAEQSALATGLEREKTTGVPVVVIPKGPLGITKASKECQEVFLEEWNGFTSTLEKVGENDFFWWAPLLNRDFKIETIVGQSRVGVFFSRGVWKKAFQPRFVAEDKSPKADHGDGYGWGFENHSERAGW